MARLEAPAPLQDNKGYPVRPNAWAFGGTGSVAGLLLVALAARSPSVAHAQAQVHGGQITTGFHYFVSAGRGTASRARRTPTARPNRDRHAAQAMAASSTCHPISAERAWAAHAPGSTAVARAARVGPKRHGSAPVAVVPASSAIAPAARAQRFYPGWVSRSSLSTRTPQTPASWASSSMTSSQTAQTSV